MPTPGRLAPSALLLALAVAPPGSRGCEEPPPPAPALDPTFGGLGYVHAGRARDGVALSALAQLDDGRIVLGGAAYLGLGGGNILGLRHLADGAPDPSFHGDGAVTWNPCHCSHFRGGIHGIRRLSDGTLLLAGSTAVTLAEGQPRRESVVLLRHLTDGSFGGVDVIDTGTETSVTAVAFPAREDLVVVAGHREDRLFVARTLGPRFDPSFAASTGWLAPDVGGTASGAGALALDGDGRLLVAGWRDDDGDRDLVVARLLPTGALDPAFGAAGLLRHARPGQQEARGLAVLPDGRVLVAAATEEADAYRLLLLRLLPTGALDPSFGAGGVALARLGPADPGTQHTLSMATMADGRILVATNVRHGGDSRPVIARFQPDGALDGSFGEGGEATFAVQRGPAWTPSPKGGDETTEIQTIAVTREGKLLVTGTWSSYPFQGFLARLTL